MTAIDDKFAALGGSGGFLGSPTIPERAAPDGIGRFRHYQNGSIFWTAATGAHEVHGAILSKWRQLGSEGSVLGYPTTDEKMCPDRVGRFNHFQRSPTQQGSVYWSPSTGAHEVHGAIRGLWSQIGWERSLMGYPRTDERPSEHGAARTNTFERGEIYWESKRGAYEVFAVAQAAAVPAASGGQWQVAAVNSAVVGVHAALLHTGEVLFFTYREPPGPEPAPEVPQNFGESAVWKLTSSQLTRPPHLGPTGQPVANHPNLFCSGHAFLGDGRLLVAGGERQKPAIRGLHTFTPGDAGAAGAWRSVGQLASGRWYATPVTLADGRVLIMGGDDWQAGAPRKPNATYEIYDPASGLSAPRPAPIIAEQPTFSTFPFVFVLPSGKVSVHAGMRTRFFNPSSGTFDPGAVDAAPRPQRNGRTYPLQGTSALLPLLPDSNPPYRARVMTIGGGVEEKIRTQASATCEILDMDAAPLLWRLAAPMKRPRVMPDTVLLPDGKLLVMNGSSTGFADNGANPVFQTELYDPSANTWTTMDTMTVPRLYHATALLLPDGKVMTAGTDSAWQPDPHKHAELRIELFSPPYLFAGPRPTITDAPGVVIYGAQFNVATPDAGAISAVALLRCGSCTHSFNFDQRHVGCRIVARAPGMLTVEAPPNGNVAPPGYYLLFILSAGVPSVAPFVRLGAA